MIVIVNLLFILYSLLVILAVIALLYFTPKLIENAPWLSWLKSKTDDQKVLTILPVHIILIILAVTSVWKFQLWKIHYEKQSLHEQIIEGNAPIEKPYYNFIVRQYPDIGEEYRRISSEIMIINDRLKRMDSFKKSLKNQQRFINNITGHWEMMADQLGMLKASIETKSKAEKKSKQIAEQIHSDLKQEISQTYAQVLSTRLHIESLMKKHASISIRFLNEPMLDEPGYSVFPLKKDNYYRVISFFLSEHSELISPLDSITQTIRKTTGIIANLKQQLKAKHIKRKDVAKTALLEWEDTKKYAHLRLLKILYAVETEYLLQEMGMETQHPIMKKLHDEIKQMIPYYAQEVQSQWLDTQNDSNPVRVLTLH